MPNDYFEFKQFKIKQNRCAMKVSTDAVLLGAWVIPNGSQRILDIGTGNRGDCPDARPKIGRPHNRHRH